MEENKKEKIIKERTIVCCSFQLQNIILTRLGLLSLCKYHNKHCVTRGESSMQYFSCSFSYNSLLFMFASFKRLIVNIKYT